MRLELLEQRLLRGEKYLERNPQDRDSRTLYWRLTAEYVSLVEQQEREADITAVTLQLPPGVAWQRAPGTLAFERVTVRMRGEAQAAGEMTREELGELLQTTKMVKEAL